VDALKEAVRRDPDNYLPYMLLGFAQMNQINDYDSSVANFRKALERNPRVTLVRTGLAQALLRKGELEKAGAQYEKLRETDRISLQGLYGLGRIYVRTGEPEKGRQTLEAAKERAQADMESLGESSRGQRQELIQSIELATADALVVQGRYDEARAIVADSESEQAPAILTLLNTDPDMYRDSVEDSEIY
jgi:tetratricopeptide (TPR) repeat protein